MTRRQRAAARLWHGSATLTRKYADGLAGWVRAGPNIPSRLGRIVALGTVVFIAARIIRTWPVLLWLIVPAWCIAAVRNSPPVEGEQEPAAGQPEALPVDAVRSLLFECLGNRPAVHLSTVLAHLQERGHGEGWTVSDLRTRLDALGIPVRLKVKVGRVPTRGVHRDDLAPPSPVGDPAASAAPSTAA